MKNTDLSGLSLDQLQQQIIEEKDRLVKLKFAHAITPIENPRRITEARKNIAKLFTAMSSKR